jgi:photosystem II stability/assembly factor-like uncharacterized protein
MRKKSKLAFAPLTKLGGPQAGSVAAIAVGPAPGATLFAGTQVGLFRLEDSQGTEPREWQRQANAPLGISSLAVSPSFAQDHILVAGTNTGIHLSRDGGETWLAAEMPISGSVVIAISFSPNYAADGILLAGTLEDGIFYSNDRGARWQSNGFGLLDATVYCLAFSPNFGRDTTVFAGTDTAIYYSYNGARAWKQLDFPDSAGAALSLAISPNFEADHALYLGTEKQGLYRSGDSGRTWRRLGLPAECINDLAVSEPAQTLLAATEAGVFASSDQGETWSSLLDQPNVISLASAGETTVAGVVDQGVWPVTHPAEWQPIPKLSARSVLGLALSPQFDEQPVAFMYGPQEGVWRTADGGRTWEDLRGELPSLDISALVVSPDFSTNPVAVAASPEGVLVTTDAGDHWTRAGEEPASLVAFSPNGKLLVASLPTGGIRVSEDLGQQWVQVAGPWDAGGKIAALAVSDSRHYYIAAVQGVGETLSIWQGEADQVEKVVNQPAGENPVVAFYIPAVVAPDRAWYAGCGNRVWKFRGRKGQPVVQSIVFPSTGPGESILSLTGVHSETGQILLAGTGRHVFKLSDNAWRNVYDFGSERAIALALSPTYLNDKTIYALLLGGSFGQVVIR